MTLKFHFQFQCGIRQGDIIVSGYKELMLWKNCTRESTKFMNDLCIGFSIMANTRFE